MARFRGERLCESSLKFAAVAADEMNVLGLARPSREVGQAAARDDRDVRLRHLREIPQRDERLAARFSLGRIRHNWRNRAVEIAGHQQHRHAGHLIQLLV